MTKSRLTVLSGAATLLALAHGVFAQTPPPARAALVLEVNGSTTPALKPYREILSGTTVMLDPASRLVFLHYDTCRTITMSGGTVSFTPGAAPAIQGASSKSDVRGQCPRKVAGSGASAATIFRSLTPPAVNLSATPSFVLVGRRADEFVRVRVLRHGDEILARPLDGPRFLWPAGSAPLPPGDYQLALVSGRAGAQPVVVNFKANAAPARAADEGMTLITLD
jgi:hypothetical protein